MKVIVTGANGLIGKCISEYLEMQSIKVIRFVGKSSVVDEEDTYQVDITAKKSLKFRLNDVDSIVHTAGLAHQFGNTGRERFWDVNVEGTRNIADFCLNNNIKHFIQISSVSVYGDFENRVEQKPVKENFLCNPKGFYAESKLEAEKVCRQIFDENTCKLTILRLSTVIGEGDIGNVLRLIRLIDQRKFIWIGNGSNNKSLVYKEDVARAVCKVIENKRQGTEVFNVSADPVKMKEIVDTISSALKKNIYPFKLPGNLLIGLLSFTTKMSKSERLSGLKESIEKWLTDDIYSNEKLKDQYGFTPVIPVREALIKETNWYVNNK